MFNFGKNKKIKKILIFRLGAIGDVVHSSALFRSIKKYDPDISIHYLTTKTPSLLLESDHDLDKVWITEEKKYKYLLRFAKELKKEKYDLCLNLQPSIRTKVFSFFIGAKSNLTYKKTFKLHAVENFWRTAKPVFKNLVIEDELKLYISPEIQEKVSHMLPEGDLIAFNMGVSMTRQGRRWPLEYWQELAKQLLNKYSCKIILTGSQDDKEISEKLLKISPDVFSFCGKLSIAENAALLSKCKTVISGDTGPLHIATAVGVPVIGLYGAAPVSRTGPYGKNTIALKSDRDCAPCNKRKCRFINKGDLYTPCMEDITPDVVIKNIEKLNPVF